MNKQFVKIHWKSKEASMRAKHFCVRFDNNRNWGEDAIPV